jgi:hypothetical protein
MQALEWCDEVPLIAETVLLVHAECADCGYWAAYIEGGHYPDCGRCHKRMLPRGVRPMRDGEDLESYDKERLRTRREHALAFVASMYYERDAVTMVANRLSPYERELKEGLNGPNVDR